MAPFGAIFVAERRDLEHRTQKWEPVLREKMLEKQKLKASDVRSISRPML
jgi:hypothetical protein